MSEFLDYEDIVPELYYSITINNDGVITGRHESKEPINSLQFYENPWLHGDVVKGITAAAEYVEGMNVGQYDDLGRYRGDVWSIENGFMNLPEGHEIVDGVLQEIIHVADVVDDVTKEQGEQMNIPSPDKEIYMAMIEEQNKKIEEMRLMIQKLMVGNA